MDAAQGLSHASANHALATVILGNDAVMAARPCTPEQLANACIAAGFDLVVPPSWGDEIVAATYLEQLAGRTEHVIVGCACPRVAALLAHRPGVDLPRLALASPPVAVARALRAVHGDSILITFVGDCPGATDPSIDVRFSPATLFGQLERQGVVLADQATEVDEHLAARWARYASVPGGLPALRFLARAPVERVLRTLDEGAFARGEIPGSRSNIVVDLTDAAQCACGGGRERIEEYEPPRARVQQVHCPPGLDMSAEPTVIRPRLVTLRGPARATVDAEAPPLQRAASDDPAGGLGAPEPPVVAPATAPAPTVHPHDGPPAPVARDRRRGVPRSALAAVPAIVLLLAAALGVAVYRGGARAGGDGSARHSNVNAARAAVTRGGDTMSDARDRALSPTTAPAAATGSEAGVSRANEASVGRATTTPGLVAGDSASGAQALVSDSAARNDSAAGAAARRRARRAAVSVVPGWLPQGRPTFTPIDTTARKPDSSRTRPAATPPDTGGPSA